ncbi:hypothetical protein H2248_000899 [Termitomyces sp. 'cryptogamus']|nr:hypothetical protein H2248_000899 [Termitomyces sp. 'cryptogamus']
MLPNQPAQSTTSSTSGFTIVPPVEQDSDNMSDVPRTPVKNTTFTVTDSTLSSPEPPNTTTSLLTTSTRIKSSSSSSPAKTPTNLLSQTLPGGISRQASNSPKSTISVMFPKTTTQISVEIPKATIPTSTSTITDQPESTFSSPVAISVINPKNGKASLSTPAFITVLSTSTQPDGGFVTFTHVVANPNITISSDSRTVPTGFLANRGAVAGVFTVVGILACSIVFSLALLCRRRHRRNRQKRWLASIQRRRSLSENPFDGPGSYSPQMRNIDEDLGYRKGTASLTSRGSLSIGHHSSNSFNGLDAAPFVSPLSVPSLGRVPVDPFKGISSNTRSDGYSTGPGHTQNNKPRFNSAAHMSPSLCPPSLPPSGDEDNITDGVPPRPPRSPLRRSLAKPSETYSITPLSSYTPSSSPIVLAAAKVTGRRTLLDVRPQVDTKHLF